MPASINAVRNTVLAIANKNNYGYISPQDFNLYAKQAQMDMFEDYFYQYNNWINRENARSSGTGYADIIKGLEEVIDSFSVQAFLAQLNPVAVPNVPSGLSGSAVYSLPGDYYLINKLYRYPTRRVSGTTSNSIPGLHPSYRHISRFLYYRCTARRYRYKHKRYRRCSISRYRGSWIAGVGAEHF